MALKIPYTDSMKLKQSAKDTRQVQGHVMISFMEASWVQINLELLMAGLLGEGSWIASFFPLCLFYDSTGQDDSESSCVASLYIQPKEDGSLGHSLVSVQSRVMGQADTEQLKI